MSDQIQKISKAQEKEYLPKKQEKQDYQQKKVKKRKRNRKPLWTKKSTKKNKQNSKDCYSKNVPKVKIESQEDNSLSSSQFQVKQTKNQKRKSINKQLTKISNKEESYDQKPEQESSSSSSGERVEPIVAITPIQKIQRIIGIHRKKGKLTFKVKLRKYDKAMKMSHETVRLLYPSQLIQFYQSKIVWTGTETQTAGTLIPSID